MLRIDPRERTAGAGGPVAIQLFGEDPDTMRAAAAFVAARGADAIDINMGCPVPKVRKTGAGAELLSDPDRAVTLARAAVEGAAEGGNGDGAPGVGGIGVGGIPVTVKLRSGLRPGESSGYDLAHRLVAEAGVAAIAFHPRSASVHHKGTPDYELAARLVATLPAPVILTGGLDDAEGVREAFEATGAAAVMLARGALGNPWLFERLLGRREDDPSPEEVRAELGWTIDRAVEHLGEPRAGRYLRKFYPWYVPRLGLDLRRRRAPCRRRSSAPRPWTRPGDCCRSSPATRSSPDGSETAAGTPRGPALRRLLRPLGGLARPRYTAALARAAPCQIPAHSGVLRLGRGGKEPLSRVTCRRT